MKPTRAQARMLRLMRWGFSLYVAPSMRRTAAVLRRHRWAKRTDHDWHRITDAGRKAITKETR